MHEFTDTRLDAISSKLSEPEGLVDSRRSALKRHLELDGPVVDVEAWKNSGFSGFSLEAFTPATETLEILGAEQLKAAGGFIATLAEGLSEPAVAKAFEEMEFAPSEEYFTTLVSAFHSGGTVIFVPRNAQIEEPIVLNRTVTAGGQAVFPLTLIVTGEGSAVTVIEKANSEAQDKQSLAVHAAYVSAGAGSHVTFLSVQDYAQDVWHFAPTRVITGRDATVRTLTATMGATFTRSFVEAVLTGQGSSAELLGFYFGDRDQRVDHRTLQHHAAPNTSTDLYYKGALKGRSQAVYSGLVRIDHEAPDSDAQQKNRNLLLSNEASADASPFLEILTSEVQRATHGVSVGRPDGEVLFYLGSRGLDAETAQRLFVKGFFQEVIDRVGVGSISTILEDLIEAELDLEDGVDV